MVQIRIQILKIIDTHQPGFVECQFTDAWGVLHLVHDKIPIVTCEDLWTDSEFPTDGAIRCKILKEWINDDGRKLITVSTQTPDYVETTNGKNEFDLLPHQLINTTI
ncbi:MAG: hypothetical protein FWD48_10870 [Oscillospiraceae bacterium]|nr:hypothetical protein [Oscillospiraceae bacterium]